MTSEHNTNSTTTAATKRCCIIVGCGPGLSRSVAIKFAKEGYNLVLVSRRKESTEAIAAEIRELSLAVNTMCVAADCTDSVLCAKEFVAIAESQSTNMGAISVLVYNTGPPVGFPMPSILDVTVDAFQKCLTVGCTGFLIWAQLVIPVMLKNGGVGTLLVSGATASLRGGAKYACLAAPKFALRALAQSIGREFQPQGIHVCHFLLDGLIYAPRTAQMMPQKTLETYLHPDGVAHTYHAVVTQPKSAWSHEIDLRPHTEKWSIN